MKIVVDTLGSDLGDLEIIKACKEFKVNHSDCELILVGKKENLTDFTNTVDANVTLKMDTHSFDILHDKDSSMAKAIDEVNKSNADGIVSAGSTGALLTLSTIKIRRLPNIVRPCLVSRIPNINNHSTIMLDLGANNSNKLDEIISFIKMSKVYYKALFEKDANFSLLSNGKEESKGSPLNLEVIDYIKKNNIQGFKGNIEANEILTTDSDIIITDGYSGNIALKAIEGTGAVAKNLLKKTFLKSLKSKVAYLFIKKDLKKNLNMLSSKPLGGAILLGVNKVVVKAHGNSDSYAFYNALEVAYKAIKNNLIENIKGQINEQN